MKVKVVVRILLIIFFIYIGHGIFVEKPRSIPENTNLNSQIQRKIMSVKDSAEKIIDFDNILKVEWDEMYIIIPYTNLDDFENSTNVKGLIGIKTKIESDDSTNLIIFTKEKQIVSYINYPRKDGDFSSYRNDDIELGILKKNCRFNVNFDGEWVKLYLIK